MEISIIIYIAATYEGAWNTPMCAAMHARCVLPCMFLDVQSGVRVYCVTGVLCGWCTVWLVYCVAGVLEKGSVWLVYCRSGVLCVCVPCGCA